MLHTLIAAIALCIAADTTPILGWNKQLFPSYLIGTATMNIANESDEFRLGDSDGLLGISVVAPHDKTPIRVTIQCDGFLDTSSFTGTLAQAGKTYEVYPKIKYRFDRLSRCGQSTPATVTIQVQIDNEVQEHSSTITFRSIHDCPINIESKERSVDISFTLASYVNEQHPFVDMMLREALDIGIVDGFDGYRSNSEAQVTRQVYAIWDLLVARDLRLSSVSTPAAGSTMVKSIPVRLIEETINNQQATSWDGSVLFVSMLRKIGIDASLVVTPGQCYVAFFVDEKHTKLFGIETTLIGKVLDSPSSLPAHLEMNIEEDYRDERSWPSFVSSWTSATDCLRQNRDKFDDPNNNDFQIIDIANARRIGVLPIPFSGKERFVAFDHSGLADEPADENAEDWGDESMDESEEESEE